MAEGSETPEVPESSTAQNEKKPSTVTALVKELSDWEKILASTLACSEALQILSGKGFTQEKLTALLTDVGTAKSGDTATAVALGTQMSATQTEHLLYDEVKRSLADFREAARGYYVSKAANPGPWATLELSGNIPKSTLGLAEKAISSYSNAMSNNDILTALGAEGYDRAKLEAVLGKAQALKTADQAQLSAMGAGIGTTSARDAKVKALRPRIRSFKSRARREFADRPDLLKTIGL